MDTAYHLEALRRQRLLDRALEAKERLREKEAQENKKHRHYHCNHCNLTKPASQPQISDIEITKKRSSHSATPTITYFSKGQQTSPPSSTDSGHQEPSKKNISSSVSGSQQSAKSNKGISHAILDGSSPCDPDTTRKFDNLTPGNHTPNAFEGRVGCASSCSCVTLSKCSQCTPKSQDRSSSCCSIAEKRAREVRKALFRQEMLLRDHNLVMGPISLEEELQIRKMEEDN